MAIDPSVIEKLKEQHQEVTVLSAGGFDVAVKTPGKAQWKRFRTMAADATKKADAVETLFRDCLLYPAPAEVEAMLAKRPALAEVFGAEVVELAGGNLEAERASF